jgi:hypothetical protein
MLNTNKGQSIIEYTALALLILVATMVMGPYVIRSIGAHFKIWQEEVSDSAHDRLLQNPEILSSVCRPTEPPRIYTGCGGQTAGPEYRCGTPFKEPQIKCEVWARFFEERGIPDGCFYCAGCNYDLSCCQTYNPLPAASGGPECGKRPLLAYVEPDRKPRPPNDAETTFRGSLEAIDVSLTGEAEDQSCYFGEEMTRNNCFPRFTSPLPPGWTKPPLPPIECKINSDCDARCEGYVPAGATACADTTTLTESKALFFDAGRSSCGPPEDDSDDCAMYCSEPNYELGYDTTGQLTCIKRDPVCDPNTLYGCLAGTSINGYYNGYSYYLWDCQGANNGTTTPCNKACAPQDEIINWGTAWNNWGFVPGSEDGLCKLFGYETGYSCGAFIWDDCGASFNIDYKSGGAGWTGPVTLNGYSGLYSVSSCLMTIPGHYSCLRCVTTCP